GGERLDDGQNRADGVDGRKPAALREHGGEVLAHEPLHDDVGLAVIGSAEIEDADDSRVPEPGGGTGLTKQALRGFRTARLLPHQLDRDFDVEGLVVSEPDVAHAAATEDPEEAILAGDAVARRVVGDVTFWTRTAGRVFALPAIGEVLRTRRRHLR